jgi:hypothetical protein
MPFPNEDTVMMIYDGHPSLGTRRASNLSPGTPTHCSWGARTQGCKDTNFLISLYINVCRDMDMYITITPKQKKRW